MASIKYELPNTEAVDLARASAAALTRQLQNLPLSDRAQIKMGGEDLILPRGAIELLREILADMSAGKAVAIVPKSAEITTQQAADLLNVSRPYLISLLESNALPYSKVGTHRRVKLEDILKYKNEMIETSKAAMDELAELTRELNME